MTPSLLAFYATLAASYLAVRPLASLAHALGHLLALRIAGGRGRATAYIGSLGESRHAWHVRIGKTDWVLHRRMLLMRGTLLDHDTPLPASGLAAVALGGPLASLALAAGAAATALGPLPPGGWRAFLAFVACIAALDLLLAFIRPHPPIPLRNGRITLADGQMLALALRLRGQADAYLHARWLFEMDRYAEAAAAIPHLVEAGVHDKLLYEYLIYSLLMVHAPADALQWHERLARRHPLDAYDDCLHALACRLLGDRKGADDALDRAISKAPGHHEALTMRAWQHIADGDWAAARADLERALLSAPDFSAAHHNLALVLIEEGEWAKAEQHLRVALLHDHENPYVHAAWGRWHATLGDNEAAAASRLSARLLGLGEGDIAA